MTDSFHDLARYYDDIMCHVNYGRWSRIAVALSALMPTGFKHLDAACGTGVLLQKLRKQGFNSIGSDLSLAMIQAGNKQQSIRPVNVADLRALPFHARFNLITCLFDSMNFLITDDDFEQGLRELHQAMTPDGILYFDVVTERMVKDHFDGQEWTENNGSFRTTWRSNYDTRSGIVETGILVNQDDKGTVLERIYPVNDILAMLERVGFSVLGMYDAVHWGPVTHKSVRIDFIVCKTMTKPLKKNFRSIRMKIQQNILT